MTAAVAPEGLGIGARLRAGRERARLSIIQASERLHLDPQILEALEHESFDRLGAPVYVRGHLRRYAELVGERPAELQEIYLSSLRAATPLPDLTQAPRAERPPDPRKLVRPLLVVLGGVAIAAAVWWVLNDLRLPSDAPSAASSSTPPPRPPPPRPTRAEEAPVGPASTEASPSVSRADPEASIAAPAAAPGAQAPQAAPPPVAAPPPPPPRSVELRLSFDADSWVEIYDARGERLFYDVATANSVQAVSGLAPLRVTLGHAPGVRVAVDGAEVAIPDNARRADEARFVVTRSGRLARAR